MDKKEVRLDYVVYRNSFPEEYGELCGKAVNATKQAYSVYSGFSVGAAVLLDNGQVVIGANQENVAYPSGLCAERTALYHAGVAYPESGVKAMAVAACYKEALTENFTPPCGACRQVMAEVIKRYGHDFDVIMIGGRESVMLKASALLPFSFDF